jgi:hypothetical protein
MTMLSLMLSVHGGLIELFENMKEVQTQLM